jgi:hypothetical protein
MLRNEIVEESKYESGVEFALIRVPLSDGSNVWDVHIWTYNSYVQFSMANERSAREFYQYLGNSEEIVEVETNDPRPEPEGRD